MRGEGVHPDQMDMKSMEGFNSAVPETNTQLNLELTDNVASAPENVTKQAEEPANESQKTAEVNLDLTEENEKERLRAIAREDALELVSSRKLRDPEQGSDRHLYSPIELAKKYYNGDHFPKHYEIRLNRIFSDNFSLNRLELLSEAIDTIYQSEEIKLAEEAAQIANARAERYSQLAEDNGVNAVKTEEERLNAIARQKNAEYLNLVNFNKELSALLRNLVEMLSDGYED